MIAVLLVLGGEYRLFGFAVTLYPDKLIYQDRGFPRFRRSTIKVDTISSYGRLTSRLQAGQHSGWVERLVLELRTAGKPEKIYLNWQWFGQKGRQTILRWLDQQGTDKETI